MSKSTPAQCWLGLGSNLEHPEAQVRDALNALSKRAGLSLMAASTTVRTAPWGPPQPHYANAVARFETTLSPREVLRACQDIERLHRRQRTRRYGARTLDLDILMYESVILATDSLTLPHPGLANRIFVLAPLAEIDPDLVHPQLNLTMSALLRDLQRGE